MPQIRIMKLITVLVANRDQKRRDIEIILIDCITTYSFSVNVFNNEFVFGAFFSKRRLLVR